MNSVEYAPCISLVEAIASLILKEGAEEIESADALKGRQEDHPLAHKLDTKKGDAR